MSIPRLSNEHRNLGFEFTKSEDTSFILKYQDMIVWIIGSQLSVKDEMLVRICDGYLEKMRESEV